MIAIVLTFPAGRYHATPWGRHVNEGAVEWPPSPWRLLRSLVAVWKRTLSDEPQERVEPILRALAAPPRFALPPACTGHTRHYMPWDKGWNADEPGKAKTKVFDAFVALTPDSLLAACWPSVDLDPAQRELLALLLANLNFLGRAESWCEARLLDDAEAVVFGDSANCAVLTDGASPSPDDELVRTLCPDPIAAFSSEYVTDERAVTVEVVVQTGKGPKTKKEKRNVAVPVYDPNWHLCMETLRLHDQKWSDPPGSTWLWYTRSRDCFEIKPAPRKARPASGPSPQVVRFALDSAVLPLVTDTLPVAEAARRALIYRLADVRGRSRYGHEWSRKRHKAGEQPVPLEGAIIGKDAAGKPGIGHTHAYYLPTDEDRDGRIDHLTIIASGGFTPDEMRAMEGLREIRPWARENASHPLRILMLGYGRFDEYRPSLLGSSRVWVSATPYLATRYAKARGRKRIELGSPQERAEFLMADLRAQIRVVRDDLDARIVADVRIAPQWDENGLYYLAVGEGGRRAHPIQFKRYRSKSGDDGGRRLAGAFGLIFSDAVRGPITLGGSNHFGMGLFVPHSDAGGRPC